MWKEADSDTMELTLTLYRKSSLNEMKALRFQGKDRELGLAILLSLSLPASPSCIIFQYASTPLVVWGLNVNLWGEKFKRWEDLKTWLNEKNLVQMQYVTG